ncbi:hypothetical protein DSM104443_04137 [Usitatibacter rugosus]|uniref:Uncharacterized protein n=1 Tax=Usitatibacter rugosus TaxID=2732067 RepID=A0A6M4H2U5_9PROT|nr:hypothetical protein [Usitatibacter rugosus]QJR13043.1 hypothetical protein DSM104443_04137 [Usitatibacter rugosus]
MNRLFVTQVALCAGLATAVTAALAQSVTLSGAELAPATLLKSPRHTVAEPVTVEGHLGVFVIESKFGKFTVRGTNLLAARVQELQAIEELQKVQKDSAFTEALGKSASGIAKFAVNTVDDPGKTAESIGKGVGTVFGRMGYMAKSGASYVGDKAVDATTGASKGAGGSAPAGDPAPPSFTGDPFGYNKARREWAKKLNIDPYTSNPVLRPLLDSAAQASFAGNFAVNLTLGAAMAPISYAYSFDETVRDSVWNKAPVDLEKENLEKLLALGVKDRTARDFARNKWFTPSLQTALVARLGALGRIDGMDSVIATAANTQGEVRARFLLESLAMLAAFHEKDGKLTRIRMSNLVPVGSTADGRVVAALAIDYALWDADAKAFTQRKELTAKSRTLLIAGKASPEAKAGLEKAGWIVKPGLRA